MPDQWSMMTYAEADGGWISRISLPSFAACQVKWYVSPDDVESLADEQHDAGDDGVPLTVRTAVGEKPSSSQREAYDFLIAKESKICKAVLSYLLAEMKESYFAESLPALDECSKELKATVKRFHTVKGFCELVRLSAVTILSDAKEGVAYSVFDFRSALDLEHGFSVLVHRDQPIKWAGSGEDGGGPPRDDNSANIDWDMLLNAVNDYLAIVKPIKNVATANAAIPDIERLLPGMARVGQEMMRIQRMPPQSFWSAPQWGKLLRTRSAISDQYCRIAKKEDVVAVIDQKLKDDPMWQGCVSAVRKFAKQK